MYFLRSFSSSSSRRIVEVTDSALKRLKKSLCDQKYIRLTTKRRGCSGVEYNLEPSNEMKLTDERQEIDGISIIFDSASVLYIIGSKIDIEEDEISSQFVVVNNNAKGVCGCGKSFLL